MAEAGELRAAVEEWDESEDEDDDIVCIFGSFRQTAQESFEAKKRPKRGGSVPGKVPNKRRDFQARYHRMIEQYFAADPVYNARDFRRRFRMNKRLFLRDLDGVLEIDRYFEQRPDCKGDLGIHPLMKVTAALRVLAYADSADALDENLEMSKSVIYDSVKHFIDAVDRKFGSEYLRAPTEEDLARLLEVNARRGFVGMWASIDCMHWEWKNCPSSVAGQFKGKEKKPTVVLEACADQELWIWHANFGHPGSLNDINILDRSTVFDALMRGESPQVEYKLNDKTYSMTYCLADGIYPDWPVFIKPLHQPLGNKQKYFTKRQEACRKDVERAFGVLQARWRILALPCRLLSRLDMNKVMRACIILHNMVVEDSREELGDVHEYLFDEHAVMGPSPEFIVSRPHGLRPRSVRELSERIVSIENTEAHFKIRDDIIDHLWLYHAGETHC
ncbi:hypothetical protein PF002_g31064 [Phytophthora fragariae]|uniref:DDE Tnp4 domain-containing protein n=1 Tax=Phytophthora fragariae TaxID=53985 RepID=A0A6A3VJ29_9STRA|nr:hypothetical protein PF002_g31064 [Phytophthora fragariae]